MKTKSMIISLILVLCLSAVMAGGTSARQQLAWKQVNQDGFGDFLNFQLPAMTVFRGQLYTGTWHLDWGVWTPSAQIWRTADGQTWEMVDSRPVNGVATLAVFKDYIYAASWQPDGQIWRSQDGLNWEVVPADLGGSNLDATRFTVFKNALYLNSWNGPNGTETWKTTDGLNWARFGDYANDDPNNYGAIASEEFKGRMYWGVGNDATGAQVWRMTDDGFETVVADGFGTPLNVISALATFGNELYASGYSNLTGQTQVWRTADGVNWQPVKTIDQTGWTTALEVYRNQLYMVVEDDYLGLNVWRTANGLDWEQIASGGFDDPNNQWTFFDSATTVFRGDLYIATINWGNGGEVWKLGEEE